MLLIKEQGYLGPPKISTFWAKSLFEMWRSAKKISYFVLQITPTKSKHHVSKLPFHLTTNNSDSDLKLSYFSLILAGFEPENIVFVSVEHEGVVAACFRCHQRVRRRKLRRTCNFQVSGMSRLEDRVSVFFLRKIKTHFATKVTLLFNTVIAVVRNQKARNTILIIVNGMDWFYEAS